ncbi:uncharacterized protein LOC142530547 [Primulina tabacum]|uniref:uncharacterized protein LOC142530547 n=1 Tax=Primulina tabacum TaxID=48773 RepID=UPI003F59848B
MRGRSVRNAISITLSSACGAPTSASSVDETGHKATDFPKLKQPVIGRAYVMHPEQAEPDTTLITVIPVIYAFYITLLPELINMDASVKLRIFIAGVTTYALLDSGDTLSFVSESFVKLLGILSVDEESGFRVTVSSDKQMMPTSMVKDVELKLQKNRFVSIRQHNVKSFIFEDVLMSHIISYIHAKKLILRGCQGFLASIISAPDAGSRSTGNMEVVKEFLDVFPDDVSGVPPERRVEFTIELMPSTVQISKATYRLAPAEIKELKDLIQGLLDKGFIRPRFSP